METEMKCGRFDKTGPKCFHNICCCICEHQLEIHQCTCGKCFSAKAKLDFKYVCTAFAYDGIVVPCEKHSMCEAFSSRTRNRNENEVPVESDKIGEDNELPSAIEQTTN